MKIKKGCPPCLKGKRSTSTIGIKANLKKGCVYKHYIHTIHATHPRPGTANRKRHEGTSDTKCGTDSAAINGRMYNTKSNIGTPIHLFTLIKDRPEQTWVGWVGNLLGGAQQKFIRRNPKMS